MLLCTPPGQRPGTAVGGERRGRAGGIVFFAHIRPGNWKPLLNETMVTIGYSSLNGYYVYWTHYPKNWSNKLAAGHTQKQSFNILPILHIYSKLVKQIIISLSPPLAFVRRIKKIGNSPTPVGGIIDNVLVGINDLEIDSFMIWKQDSYRSAFSIFWIFKFSIARNYGDLRFLANNHWKKVSTHGQNARGIFIKKGYKTSRPG